MLKPSRFSLLTRLAVTALAAWLWHSDPKSRAQPSASGSIFITRVNVFDPDSASLLTDRDVSIRAGLIQSIVAHSASASPPTAGARSVDGRGKTLVPGLSDAAVFASLDGSLPEDRRAGGFETALRIQLQAGVCQALDLNASRAQIQDAQSLAASLRIPALRLGGGLLTSRGGWRCGAVADGSSPAFEISSSDDLEQAFRSNLADGATLVVATVENIAREDAAMSPELLLRLGQLCRASGMPLVIHVEHPSKALAALAASPQLLLGSWASETVTPELVAAMLRSHCAYAPGLQGLMGFQPPHDVVAALRGMSEPSWLRPEIVDSLGNWQAMLHYSARFSQAQDSSEMAAENVAALAGAGVPIVLASMSGMPGLPHGAAIRAELGRLVDAGLSPSQALRAATLAMDKALKAPTPACIAPGCAADLLLVAGDPSKGLNTLRHPLAVIRGGRYWSMDELAGP
jgi:imidazolonepropionase-like amidohydrolase